MEVDNILKNVFCNNCRKYGHIFNKCKIPIISYGIIVCRINTISSVPFPEFLMICRKKTLGYIDFMRGKYSTTNKYYIMNMLKQMTVEERSSLLIHTFDELWNAMWKSEDKENVSSISAEIESNQYRQEEINSKSKYNALVKGIYSQNEFYNLESMVKESYEYTSWNEQEWGFPKGRRNYQENEYECAIREFTEETGYSGKWLKMVVNIYPFEEVFMGSNYKTYKHKYFLTFMDYAESLKHVFVSNTEVSNVEWLSYDECMSKIRPYNQEKKDMITKVNNCIHNYMF